MAGPHRCVWSKAGLGDPELTTFRWRMGLSPHILPFQHLLPTLESREKEWTESEGKMVTWDYGFDFDSNCSSPFLCEEIIYISPLLRLTEGSLREIFPHFVFWNHPISQALGNSGI